MNDDTKTTPPGFLPGYLSALDDVGETLEALKTAGDLSLRLGGALSRLRSRAHGLAGVPMVEGPEDPMDRPLGGGEPGGVDWDDPNRSPEARGLSLDVPRSSRSGVFADAPPPLSGGRAVVLDWGVTPRRVQRAAHASAVESAFGAPPPSSGRAIAPDSPHAGAFPRPKGDPLDWKNWDDWIRDGWDVFVSLSPRGLNRARASVEVYPPAQPDGPPVMSASGVVQVPPEVVARWASS